MFMNDVVQVARQEMAEAGYTELKTSEDVDAVIQKPGKTFVMINSVCGCAGGIARPTAKYMKNYDVKADNYVTVFAGQDREATAQVRSYCEGYEPSSPSFALLKDGEIQTMIERHEIEGHEPMEVAEKLENAFDQYFK
ncbi:putative bacilliredoxin, YphP/YqiW family [Evansella caseinilytica]|uniref:Putative bacilliredoxin, YphP/YqiW family n=1 Tax=Evansella caseinilytica TaxID=1503961 RepID=A0A1H3L0L3_9BACI|nr:putative bacilliredoxin, YphP/YqiW family [Evansella caseinilytica]